MRPAVGLLAAALIGLTACGSVRHSGQAGVLSPSHTTPLAATATAPPPSAPCTAVVLATDPASPAFIGTAVAVTGTASGCDRAELRFWVIDPTGVGVVTRAWAPVSSWTWATAGAGPGRYGLRVDARAAGRTDDSQDASASVLYSLNDTPPPAAPCANLGISPSLASPQPAGTTVTFTASVKGCATALFLWWLTTPDGVGLLIRDWSSDPSYVWSTPANAQTGAYRVQARARDASDTATEVSGEIDFTLT